MRVALLEDGSQLCEDCFDDDRRERVIDSGSPLVRWQDGECDYHVPEETAGAFT